MESRDDDALAAGSNLAMLGGELIQFGEVTPLGGGCFRLKRLLRARRGTEWAMPLHKAGESFVIVDPGRLKRVPVTAGQTGAMLRVTPRGLADQGANSVEHVIVGEAMRPPSPVHLRATADGAAIFCAPGFGGAVVAGTGSTASIRR